MDPYLAQGFSNLTKALIGDAETDYQVARTNRVNELLPLEKRQIESNIGQNDASAAAARALETLRKAQTLTEDQLRNPRVQSEIANAQATLALAAERNAAASANTALANQRNELTPELVLSEQALANSRNSDAGAADALAQSRTSDAMFRDAQTKTEDSLRGPKVNTENANTSAANALANERNTSANANTALENERNTAADANTALAEDRRASAAARERITLSPGQTIIYTDENGQEQKYTAPKQTELTLSPGEEAVVIGTDGTEKRYKGPEKGADPKDGSDRLANVDEQLDVFFGPDAVAFTDVDTAVLRRIRANITKSVQGKGVEEAASMIQDLLSQTINGSSQYKVTTGRNFTVPAFVALQVQNAPSVTAEQVASMYGLSKDQAQRLIDEVRQ
jgi:hypothetical protein